MQKFVNIERSALKRLSPARTSKSSDIFSFSMTVLFLGRINIKHLVVTLGICVVLGFLVYQFAKTYPDAIPRLSTWQERVSLFFEKKEPVPKTVFTQENNAKIAIAEGRLIGVFPGNSKQRNTLANAPSDFIYAIIVEEYGLLGGIVIVLLYLIIFYRAIRIATKTPKYFSSLLVFGCSFLIVLQAFIIMGYTVGVLPTTGLPLPLISMGGTSIWFTAINMGIILSISRELDNEKTENATI